MVKENQNLKRYIYNSQLTIVMGRTGHLVILHEERLKSCNSFERHKNLEFMHD